MMDRFRERTAQLRCAGYALACTLAGLFAGTTTAHEGARHDAVSPPAAAAASPAGSRWGANYFPNLPLVNQDGETLRLWDDLLKGKAVAVNVIYTGCSEMCPMETANLVRVQKLLGDRVGRDIHFLSISIDPLNDTPQALKSFANKFGVGPGWQFVTGKPEDIEIIVRKLGLSRNSDSNNRDGHTASLMVGDVPNGQWLRNSAIDNPQFLVSKIGTFLGKWNELLPTRSYAEVTRGVELKGGEYTFQSNCATCHTIGDGKRIGPDLLGVTARRDRAWLTRYIQTPNKVRAEGDATAAELAKQFPDVRMPNMNLAAGDVALLIGYLESQSAAVDKVRKVSSAR